MRTTPRKTGSDNPIAWKPFPPLLWGPGAMVKSCQGCWSRLFSQDRTNRKTTPSLNGGSLLRVMPDVVELYMHNNNMYTTYETSCAHELYFRICYTTYTSSNIPYSLLLRRDILDCTCQHCNTTTILFSERCVPAMAFGSLNCRSWWQLVD